MDDSNTLPLALNPPNPAFKFRAVLESDFSALMGGVWAHRTRTRGQELLRRITLSEHRKRGIGLVVEDEQSQSIIAYGQSLHWSDCTEISDLFVMASHRGRGLGTALIQSLIQEAIRRWDATCIEIGVAQSNPRAFALYQRLGFHETYMLMLDLGTGREPVTYLRLSIPK